MVELVARLGFGYLLKDRVLDVSEFIDAAERVAAGGTALDPKVVAALVAGRTEDTPLARLSDRELHSLRTGGWLGGAPSWRAPVPGVVLADRLKRVLEVVLCNVAAHDDAGDAREAVVQSRPDPRVDDPAPKLVRGFEVEHGIEVSGRPRRIEAVDVEVDLVGVEEGSEDLGHRRRD